MSESERIPSDWDLEYAWPVVWILGRPAGQANPMRLSDGIVAENTWYQREFSSRASALMWDFGLDAIPEGVTEIHAEPEARRKGWVIRRMKVSERPLLMNGSPHRPLVFKGQDWYDANPDIEAWIMPCTRHQPVHGEFLVTCHLTRMDAARNKLTRIKPGRFLGQFFPDIPEAERARLAIWLESHEKLGIFVEEEAYPLHIASTPDEIASVYRIGPGSCMKENSFTLSGHPTRVYGAGDLAVYYFKAVGNEARNIKAGRIITRALCWPEKQVFGRIYPTNGGNWETDGWDTPTQAIQVERAMAARFLAMGWDSAYDKRQKMYGARLSLISHGVGMAKMPYIDCSIGVKSTKEGFVFAAIGERGVMHPQSTGGYVADGRVTWRAGQPTPDVIPEAVICPCCNARSGINPVHTQGGVRMFCISCMNYYAGARFFGLNGALYYAENGRYESFFFTPSNRLNMPVWWADQNTYRCSYSQALVANTVPRVTLHNGQFAMEYQFQRTGYTDPKTGLHYYSRKVWELATDHFGPQLPEGFDEIEGQDYELLADGEEQLDPTPPPAPTRSRTTGRGRLSIRL